jgi:2-polyprenyl-3-methyl-5-hydroxy-6-metoxy-1,4-benzoquinol methylase
MMDKAVAEFHPRDRCPMCQSGNLNDRRVLDGLRIAGCAACGFMFSRDTLAPLAIDQFYIDGYHDRRHMDGQRVNARINVELLRQFCPDLSGKTLLDVGSGYGFFLDGIRNSGAQRIAGVELSQAQRKYSVDELKLETFAELDALSGNDKFDIITIFEVIEHIPSPAEFIMEVCEHLKVGGSLIVGTDNFVSNVVNVLGDRFPKWIPHEHVSFFTPASLRQMLTRSGQLTFADARSFTPWELLLRQQIFSATSGRKGGKTYSYQAERSTDSNRGYRFFPLRLKANHLWFKLTHKPDLDGEMMYIHMIKS